MQTSFDSIWIQIPEIYLPKETTDRNKRSVVACDQYTSQPEYRESVKTHTEGHPSTLNIIFPEVYLEEENWEERIASIKHHMNQYLSENILENKGTWFIYIDRKTSHNESRKGLIVALDLEKYDYSKGSQTLIRATEGTILDRLPPRIKIREGAPLESPHIMVLIDDPEKTIIEPLADNIQTYTKLYDFDLMMNGGHITGYQITDEESIKNIITGLEQLANKETFKNKYGVGDELGVLLFAMGDGNHSFATAKAIWEEKKKNLTPEQQQNHPARFALVELNNVHDQGITFEPIHRVLFNINNEEFFQEMETYFKNIWSELITEHYNTKEELKANLKPSSKEIHYLWGVNNDGYFILGIKNPKLNLEVGNLQNFLDFYLKNHPESKIDYVHGEEVTETLGKEKNNLGLLLPIMDKSDFFKTVVVDGALPRKTFSMGEAEEKRFYLECRKIG